MLILTRRAGDSIVIGDDIRIYVKEVRGRQVQIGIIAPDDVTIRRAELRPFSDEERREGSDARSGNNMLPGAKREDRGGRRG